ncbi:MAG: nucleotidyltransferase family protein [Elusimicrobiales bacterium]|nr:nucleotidyltransferase family protein [Elusimicrobiales bacterium]
MSMDVVILCGGKGTRLRAVVSDRPKPMAAVGGKPFLELLMDYVAGYGFGRFVLCAGYMGEMIRDYFAGRKLPYEVAVAIEAEPLDTAGAVKNAEGLIKSGRFMAMNGDSIVNADLKAFAAFHEAKRPLASLAAAKKEDASAFGTLQVGGDGKLLAFREKAAAASGLVNAGIYIFEREVLGLVPEGKKYSLERDLFPALAAKGGVNVFEVPGELIDIGTPEGYKQAGEKLK